MHGSLPAWTTHAITDITSRRTAQFDVNGAARQFRNTNRMVGRKGWHILLSKTGYTREAGRCLTMLLEEAGRKVLVVLMGRTTAQTARWTRWRSSAGWRASSGRRRAPPRAVAPSTLPRV